MKTRILLVLLLTGSLAGRICAQPANVRFDHMGEESLSQTFSILQDHEGFMWFGSSELFRYDGYTLKQFKRDPSESTSLSGFVGSLYEDLDDVLWVGTSHGLSRFDRETETFRRFQHDPDNPTSLGPGWVSSLLEDRQGNFWVGTNGGLYRMDREAGTFSHYLPDSSHTWTGPLLEDRDGTLWVGSWGVNRFDPETGAFTRYLPHPEVEVYVEENPATGVNWVQTIYQDQEGQLWVGTGSGPPWGRFHGGGLHRFDPRTGAFTHYHHDPDNPGSLSSDYVSELIGDPEGGLWVGTYGGGLDWFDPIQAARQPTLSDGRPAEGQAMAGLFRHFRHDPVDPYSLSGESVTSLYRDRQGVIWVGTWYRDVNRFDRAARPFEHYYARPGNPNSLRDSHVNTIAEGPDGTVWVTGEGEASVLTGIDRHAGTYRHYQHDPADPNSLRLFTQQVYVDRSGVVWTISERDLSRMDPDRPGHFTHFRHDPDDAATLGAGSIFGIYEDTRGVLWVGTSEDGLARMDDRERGAFTRFPLVPHAGWIDYIFEDSGGLLWVGTRSRGLYRFDPATGQSVNYRHDPDDPNSLATNMILGIYERPQEPGVLWLGVYPWCLSRFDTRTETLTRFTTKDGLPDNGAQGVLGDDAGRLWISTDHGLSRFDPDTGIFKNFDVDDGLQGEAFHSSSHYQSRRTGELFFGGVNGLNAFFPDQVRDNPHPPEVLLTGLRLFNEPVSIGGASPLKQRLAQTKTLKLSHRQNDFTIEYVGLHFRHPEKNQYRYLLEGYEDAWREVGTLREATYTNLPPGAYTFLVKAANSDGVWNEEGAALKITVLPPWWRTAWAYALYTLLFLTVVVGAFRLQHARVIRRERERARERELEQAREIKRAYHELEQTHRHLQATQQQLVHAEKMASLGALTAGIAHEIKNPLNFITGFAEVNEELADDLRQAWHNGAADVEELLDNLKRNAQVIDQHGKRADAIVQSMMRHASGAAGHRESTDVNALVGEYVDLAYHGKRAQTPGFNVTLERDLGGEVGAVEMVAPEIGRVVLNLLSNAFDAVGEEAGTRGDGETANGPRIGSGTVGGRTAERPAEASPTVRISTRRVGDAVEIRVSDNGPGIPPGVREKVFEPFYTTKPAGSGTGLGLSLAYEIVTQGHGGTLAVESTEGGGATFVITLPT